MINKEKFSNYYTRLYNKEKGTLMSLDALLNDLDRSHVFGSEILTEKFATEDIDMNGFIFDQKPILIETTDIEGKNTTTKVKNAYTSDGTKNLIRLINVLRRDDANLYKYCAGTISLEEYKSLKNENPYKDLLHKAISSALDLNFRDSYQNVYYTLDPENLDSPVRKTDVIETNFNFVLENYLELSKQQQNKDTLLEFFKGYDKVVKNDIEFDDKNFKEYDYLGKSGYEACKQLLDQDKWGKLSLKDVKALNSYILFRLRRMESVMREFNNTELTGSAKVCLQQFVHAKGDENKMPSQKDVQKLIDDLEKIGHSNYKSLCTKYNRELDRYNVIVKMQEKSEAKDGKGNALLNDLADAISKTREDINGADKKINSVKNDEQRKTMEGIVGSCPKTGKTIVTSRFKY